MPTLVDGVIMLGLGLVWAGGMYCMAHAYSLALASVAAPFEYLSLPINVLWGLVFWQEIPTWTTVAGAVLTLSSGLYVLYRERRGRSEQVAHSSERSK
jgi:drug/metabolite transporter (DMT)-like permease